MSNPTERKLFGTDGIRGPANVFPMTPEVALRLGRAITLVARRRLAKSINSADRQSSASPAVVIGKDTRLSGYMLETALAAGICAMGGRVLLSGPIPTPAVAHLTHSMRADAGVVISASHNPYEDNGIKLFGPDGFKLADSEELEIEALLADKQLEENSPTGAEIGRAERIDEASGRYIVYAKHTFPKELNLRGLRIVVDAAHGAAYKVAPAVFHELGASVVSIGCSPDGKNINDGCGALHPSYVAAEVKRQKADLGIALDGDADRLIVVDEGGSVIDGDALMALCALRMLAEGRLAHETLVATVMSNMGLEQALLSAGGKLVRTQVGDRAVVAEMRAKGYNFGGEQSGHLVFAEHATTGDGIVAALQLLAVMVRAQKPLSELGAVMQPVPQILKNLSLTDKRPIAQMPLLQEAIRQAESQLGRHGRVLVRWSGTESKLRLMLEGPNEGALNALAEDMSQAARKDLSVTLS